MIRQQPEGHDTFASGDSCFCVAKVVPVALSIITVSVNWLSDKRYLCVRINHQIGPLSRTEQKSLCPQAVFREPLTYRIIFTTLGRDRLLGKSEINCVIFYYTRFFSMIKNLVLSYKVKNNRWLIKANGYFNI